MRVTENLHASNAYSIDGQTISVIQAKILYTLGIYPKLSRSMLQTGIGPAIPPTSWKPVLEDMITRGIVVESTLNMRGVGGRANSPKILELTPAGHVMNAKDVSTETETVAEHSQGRPG